MTEPGDGLFDRLVACREDVFRVCLGFSRNPADAEDLTQDVFLKAFARRDALRNPYGSKIWLLRIARTTCLDRIRRDRRRPTISLNSLPRPAMDMARPDPPVDSGADLRRIKAAAARLPRRRREVFVLREYGGLSYEEIARTLKIKIGTVMSRLNRARKAVAEAAREKIREKD
ncbi:MAG: RNA polymerase sigma factor [Candidatus Aminicenantes bacterium]|nr:RNA polymerase sigma factor [Candidatus Aminicenantes bacterium]